MHFDAARGGADRYFAGLRRGLESAGEDFTAAAFGAATGSRAISLGGEDLSLGRRWAALRGLGRRMPEAADVVATHFALYALPLLGALRGRTHVVHFHGPWAGESEAEGQPGWIVRLKFLVERHVYRRASHCITLSQAFKELLSARYGVAAERITVVPGGLDVANFVAPADRAGCRARLGWPADRRIVLCLRRLVRRMGIGELLEAFARVAAQLPGADLYLGGTGPLESELRRRCGELGLGQRVRFLGFVPEAELAATYAAADFSIVPSQDLEGFGLVTLESLACGTPVLVTPVGGLPEVVRPLDAELVLAGRSVEALAEGLHRAHAVELPSAARCRSYVEENYDWTEIAARVARVYRSAAGEGVIG
jgi:glycosyltransferase involved in cell wall biosynthesis